jgi:hypothetical protein
MARVRYEPVIPVLGRQKKVRELIALKVPHTSLLNIAVVAFKVAPLGNYAPMPALSPPIKKFWNWF